MSCGNFQDGAHLLVEDCTNSGNVSVLVTQNAVIKRRLAAAGGIVAVTSHTAIDITSPAVVRRCHNRGSVNVHSDQESYYLFSGGVVAAPELLDLNNMLGHISECTNSGNASATFSVETGSAFAAGIAATKGTYVTVTLCENTGGVSSPLNASGIVTAAREVNNSVNHGTVNGPQSAHGIAHTIGDVAVAVVDAACSPDTKSPLNMDFSSSSSIEVVFFCNSSAIETGPDTMTPMHYNGKWTTASGENVAATLNAAALNHSFSMVWTDELHLGYLVTFSSTILLPGSLMESPNVTSVPGETLRDLLDRVGASALLSPDYTLSGPCVNGTIAAACTVTVTCPKGTHTLLFAVNSTHLRVHAAHGTPAPQDQLTPYLDARKYAIVRTGTARDFFDPAAPVFASANYTVTRVHTLDVVVVGPVDERDIAAAVDAIAGPDAVVRVVAVEPRTDGTVSVIVAVEDRHADAVVDRVLQCAVGSTGTSAE